MRSVEFPRFEHADWLARAWRGGAPRCNLGSSGLQVDWTSRLPMDLEPSDLSGLDLHAQTPLQAALATRCGMAPEQVRVTAGTSGANLAVLLAFLRPGCNVVCERPYYAPLPHLAQGLGAEIRYVDRDPADGWRLDPAAVADHLDDQTALVLLTSPNNPTGAVASERDLRALGDAAAAVGARVLVDQVFQELTDHPIAARVHAACLSTAGFNKCWGTSGLRIGWLMGQASDVERAWEAGRLAMLSQSPMGTRLASELLAREAEARERSKARLEATHEVYRSWCAATGRVANLVPGALTAFPTVGDDAAVSEAALEQGLLVVPGSAFGRPGHVRVALGIEPEALAAGLERLHKVSSMLDAQTL